MKAIRAKELTPEQVNIIIQRYPNELCSTIAKDINVNLHQVYNCAHRNNIYKSSEFKNDSKSGRFNLVSAGVGSRYQVGSVPANKGVKMLPFTRDKVKHTWFEKGNKPANTKGGGAVSIRTIDGVEYQWIKIADANWEMLHRHAWAEKFGEIPKDSIISFIDGNTLNCELSNLAIMKKSENLRRNSELSRSLPLELQEVMKFNKKLKKTIKKWQQTN